MDKIKVNELILKLKQESISPQEEANLMNWLHQFNMGAEPHFDDGELFTAQEEMWQVIAREKQSLNKSIFSKQMAWVGSAAALLIIAFSLFFYNNSRVKPFYIANDIPAGKEGATLTLADGKQINLVDVGDGQLLAQAGLSVYKTADGTLTYQSTASKSLTTENQFNTLSTAKGQTYRVILPDGSKVWLNAASRLTYNTHLGEDKTREVALVGEAYFEVKRDVAHPFIVKAGVQQVEVLGTSFNISNYKEDNTTRTTLVDGSVKVKAENMAAERMIKPGEQALLNSQGFVVSKVKVAEVIDWKDGKFVFSDETIVSLMNKIARWYDVEVLYEGEVPKELFGGQISRDQPISKILEVLQLTGFVQFNVEGRRITVIPN